MRRFVLAILVVTLAVFPAPVQAHTLIVDSSRNHGAVLHISPNDEPVAGEETTLYLDTHGQILREPDTTVSVDITGETSTETVKMKIQGDLATVRHTFAEAGVYNLRLTIDNSQPISFSHAQRVSRGIQSTILGVTLQHQWAEPLLISSGVAIIVLGIVAYNRRGQIRRQIDQQMVH